MLAVACGGGASAPVQDPSTPPAATSATAAPQTASATPAATDTKADRMKARNKVVMDGCMAQAASQAYCTCYLEVATTEVPEGEWDTELSAATKEKLVARSSEQCSKLMPPELFDANFVRGCTGGDPTKDKFCTCALEAVRKKGGEPELRKGVISAESKAGIATCNSLMPEAAIRADFVKGCISGQTEAKCDCSWKALRKTFKAEELMNPAILESPKFRSSAASARTTCRFGPGKL